VFFTHVAENALTPSMKHDWAPLPSPWESRTPPELPLAIWQYTTAALNQQDNLESHSMNDFHFPSYQLSSPTSSILPSPSNTMFSHHTASLASPHVRQSSHFSRNEKKRSRTTESAEDDEDDSGGDSWDQTTPQPSTSRKSLKRSSSQRETSTNDEVSIRNAKRTHTVVEKNYRERLNDKIADLAVYLFETSSDGESLSKLPRVTLVQAK
jgi:hypothetical protein